MSTDYQRWSAAEERRRVRFEIVSSLLYVAGVAAAAWLLLG